MRSLDLLKVAAQAEVLRQQAMLARQSRRAAFGFVALVFTLGVLITAEVAAWQGLRFYLPGLTTTLVLLGINLVIAAIPGFLAVRSHPTALEEDALRVRRQALKNARGAVAFTALVPVAPRLLRLGRRQFDRGWEVVGRLPLPQPRLPWRRSKVVGRLRLPWLRSKALGRS